VRAVDAIFARVFGRSGAGTKTSTAR